MQNQAQEKGRWLTLTDLLAVQKLLSDRQLALAAGITLVADQNIQTWALNNWLNQQRLWGIWQGSELIGLLSAFPLADQQVELGYLLQREQWGKGIMTRALQEFLTQNPGPIYQATAKKENLASQKVLLKVGFKVINRGNNEITYRF